MIISRTPFRISFFGGGTDYPVWYKEEGGGVISTTIDKYCYLSCRHLPPFFEYKHRIMYSKVEMANKISEIRHPSVRECFKFMKMDKGLELHHDGDLPARTGLGSSSSFTVGLLHCLYALQGSMPTKERLANEAIHVERNLLKEHVGSQDQVAVSYGGFNKINFSRDGTFEVEPLIMKKARLERLQKHIMLYFTGFSRIASHIAKKQVKNTPKKKTELKNIQDMVSEAKDVLSHGNDFNQFGKLLDDYWCLKKTLSNKVSTASIDNIYEKACKAGATGGKLLGAGGGGFMILFVKPERQASVRKKLKNLLEVQFRFETSGSQIIFYQDDAEQTGR